MENPPWIFFMFLAITGVVFLKLGFIVFDKTDLPNSISPPVISLFKHLLAISVCHSSNYALIFRPLKPFPVHKFSLMVISAHAALLFYRTGNVNPFAFNSFFHYLLHFFVVTAYSVFKFYLESYFAYAFTAALIPLVYSSGSDSFAWYLAICVWINLLGIVIQRPILVSVFNNKMIIAIFFSVESSLFLTGGTTNKSSLFPTFFVLLVSYTTSALCSADKSLVDLFSVLSGNDKKVRFLRFGVGVVGAALFQNSVALTSFAHVAAFLCFAVAWLANLVMLRASFDFGIFEFLLGNVVVGCAVSRFGLHAPTWLFYGASVILYGLRLKLESVTMARREVEDVVCSSV